MLGSSGSGGLGWEETTSEGRGWCVRIKIYGNPPRLVQMDMGLKQDKAKLCAVFWSSHTNTHRMCLHTTGFVKFVVKLRFLTCYWVSRKKYYEHLHDVTNTTVSDMLLVSEI